MKILVLSDSHGRVGNLFDIVSLFPEVSTIIFLGDGLRDFEELKEMEVLNNKQIFYVSGNCDFDIYGENEKLFELGGKRFYILHGHTQGVKFGKEKLLKAAKQRNADICIFGHTHTSYKDYKDGIYFFNVGAVKDGYYGLINILKKEIVLSFGKL